MKTTADFKQILDADPIASKYKCRLLGIRGALEAKGAENRETVYDDLIIRDIDGVLTTWIASVDPGWSLIVNPINDDGAAQLCEGTWEFALGIHKGNPAWPCLIQAKNFNVWRLHTDGSKKTDSSGKPAIFTGDFGIHMHSGGAGEETKNFSAGCQIIRNDDGYFKNPTWENFFQPIKTYCKANNQSIIPYVLIADSGYGTPEMQGK